MAQIKMLEAALETFRMDNGRYPTTAEGLAALVQAPPALEGSSAYLAGGYLKEGRVPGDPWGRPYLYRSPDERSAKGFDLWSLGADGAPGGRGNDADIGNWPGGFPERVARPLESVLWISIAVFSVGTLVAPIYFLASASLGRRTWRAALIGAPVSALICLVAAFALLVFLVPSID